jgi:hypothetical protein
MIGPLSTWTLPAYATEVDPALEPDRGPLHHLTGGAQARLDALAEQSVRAAETHGIPSPEHDAAMNAHADAEADARAEAEAG